MDTTEKYIYMCNKAYEIQTHWHSLYESDDDIVVGKHYKTILRWLQKGSFESQPKNDWIWIPRQDQLQKMLSETCTLGYFISGLHEFFDPESLCPDADGEYPPCEKCSSAGKERRTMYETMEQWWLAFVMSEMFTKKWNGTEWVYDSSWRVPDHAEDAQERVSKSINPTLRCG